MAAPEIEPQLKNHLLVVRRRWWVVIVAALAAGAFVWWLKSDTPAEYRATAVVRISYSVPTADGGEITDFQARTYAELAAGPAAMAAAVERSGLDIGTEAAERRIDIALRSTPGFIEIGGTGPTAGDARDLVEAVTAELVGLVEEAQPEPVEGETNIETIGVEVVAPAEADGDPITPSPARTATLAALITAIIVTEAAVLLWHLQGRLSLADPAGQVEDATGFKTIDLTGRNPDSLLPLFAGHRQRRLVLTVAQRGRMPSAEVAILLAQAVCRVEGHVLVIDADTGSPVRHLSIGAPPTRPVQPELLQPEDGDRVGVRATPIGTRVAVVRSEPAPAAPSDSETRLAMTAQLVDTAGPAATVISITSASDTDDFLNIVTNFGQGVVLVVDPGRTRMKALGRLCDDVRDVGGNIAGVVLHREPKRPRRINEVTRA